MIASGSHWSGSREIRPLRRAADGRAFGWAAVRPPSPTARSPGCLRRVPTRGGARAGDARTAPAGRQDDAGRYDRRDAGRGKDGACGAVRARAHGSLPGRPALGGPAGLWSRRGGKPNRHHLPDRSTAPTSANCPSGRCTVDRGSPHLRCSSLTRAVPFSRSKIEQAERSLDTPRLHRARQRAAHWRRAAHLYPGWTAAGRYRDSHSMVRVACCGANSCPTPRSAR